VEEPVVDEELLAVSDVDGAGASTVVMAVSVSPG
jgi:hypothetical protein